MDYDEIDNYIDQLFREQEQAGQQTTETSSGDWRIERIDEIIQDSYDEAIWWHNNRISENCDPRSGLRSLPYVPWYEPIDGVAAMCGAIGGLSEGSYARNGGTWRAYGEAVSLPAEKRGLTCGEYALICGVVLGLLGFMALFGGAL